MSTRLRNLFAALALTGAVACSDNKSPTAPTDQGQATTPQLKPSAISTLSATLTNLTVTDPATSATGLFNGVLTITSFTTNTAGDLIANGTLVGTITGGITQTVNETFSQVVTTNNRCTILHLDLGPIFLDLLGLQVSTNEIVLDVTAVSGAGNLLGNLLCALVHLLDQNPLDAAIAGLLQQINQILASL